MDIIKYDDFADQSTHIDRVVGVLDAGAVACLPCNGTYRLLADLSDEAAVISLMQAKRRIAKAPSLVFVADKSMLAEVTDTVAPVAGALIDQLWPGPLTIRFDAAKSLPAQVRKTLVKATGKVGVRIPEDDPVRRVVAGLGRPVFVSSANRENKHGETSPAQIRQNFFGRISIFVDAGDLVSGDSSTVVEVNQGQVDVVRKGHVPADEIAEVT